MNEDSVTPMTPLDSMVCQDSVQILKAVVPYLNGSGKQIVSVYAKALELMNTITYFQKNQPSFQAYLISVKFKFMGLFNHIIRLQYMQE